MKLIDSKSIGTADASTVATASKQEQKTLNSLVMLSKDNPEVISQIDHANTWRICNYFFPYQTMQTGAIGIFGTLTFKDDVSTDDAAEQIEDFLMKLKQRIKLRRLLCVAERGGKGGRLHWHYIAIANRLPYDTEAYITLNNDVKAMWSSYSKFDYIENDHAEHYNTIKYVARYLSYALSEYGYYYDTHTDTIISGIKDLGTYTLRSAIRERVPELITSTGVTTKDLVHIARSMTIYDILCPVRLVQTIYKEMGHKYGYPLVI